MTETLNSVCELIVDCLYMISQVVGDGYPLTQIQKLGKENLKDYNLLKNGFLH